MNLDRWSGFRWRHVSPQAAADQPALPIEEASCLLVALLCVAHARSQSGSGARSRHTLLLLCAVIGGLGGDVIFSWLPLADNFFHAQATVMVTPRLPLYIVVFYVGWYYPAMALSWRLGLPARAEGCVSALLSFAYYWPWDVRIWHVARTPHRPPSPTPPHPIPRPR